MIRTVLVLTLLAGSLAGSAFAQTAPPPTPANCSEPRPKVCSMIFQPACGLKGDGTRQTFSSPCSACADPAVISNTLGACT